MVEAARPNDSGIPRSGSPDSAHYSVCLESHSAGADLDAGSKDSPTDRCQVPRWGYVVEGMITFRFADAEETDVAGDAY
jgi:hypothetical protein